MAQKVKWRRGRDGNIEFVEKKSAAGRVSVADFSSVALFTFIASLILVLITVILAAVCRGKAPVWLSYPPTVALALSGFGVYVVWYGHFQAGAESRIPWLFGLLTNGGMTLVLLGFYVAGSWM